MSIMKKLITLISILFLFTGCSHTYIGNTSFKKLKTASAQDYVEIGVGMGISFFTHELAHIAFIKAFNADYDIEFKNYQPHIQYDSTNLSDSEVQWISRAGLLSQNLVGLFLPKDSYFTIGYNSMSAIQTLTYPVRRDDGDLYELDKAGGSAGLEWGIYSLLSGYNLFRIEW